ncbi:MAG: chemotaxis protein CheW [Gammaproteobacteria bacterium]|nr:chemotaxis protein CheW [Gammaproteobacteria bacterium]NNF61028.1 purine-binding chemotaxis protein CheW [Gammaproteobacteria bacterium]NNM21884.1 purine-binding chemotaxis protein CheW [Gammaproteobacteria bacterium]
MTESELRAWKDRPFELLQELERRSRAAAVGSDTPGSASDEWVGVAFRIGELDLLASRDEVREVLPIPATTRVPGAVFWISGLANIRGQLLPLTDMRAFMHTQSSRPTRASRVLVVNHRQIPAGLIVDEVLGFRRYADSERAPMSEVAAHEYKTLITGAFSRDGKVIPVLGLTDLVESERFLQAAE